MKNKFIASLLLSSFLSLANANECKLNTQQMNALSAIPQNLMECNYHSNMATRPYVGSCIDAVVETGAPVLEVFLPNGELIAQTLRDAKNCQFYPNINTKPYLGSCVDAIARATERAISIELSNCNK
jgi:hypothetical protein